MARILTSSVRYERKLCVWMPFRNKLYSTNLSRSVENCSKILPCLSRMWQDRIHANQNWFAVFVAKSTARGKIYKDTLTLNTSQRHDHDTHANSQAVVKHIWRNPLRPIIFNWSMFKILSDSLAHFVKRNLKTRHM